MVTWSPATGVTSMEVGGIGLLVMTVATWSAVIVRPEGLQAAKPASARARPSSRGVAVRSILVLSSSAAC